MAAKEELVASFTEGNKAFSVLFTRWMDGNEWSHPVLVALTKAVCDGNAWFHSSQITGIRQGRSQSPGPRQFVAIWKLNTALYWYKNKAQLIPGTTSSNNYKDAEPIVREDGSLPDLGWFVEVFCGITPLPKRYQSPVHIFNNSQAERFSNGYAKLVRKLFVLRDLDVFENMDMTLLQYYPARDKPRIAKIKQVLVANEVWSADELATELVALSSLSNALGGPSSEAELLQELT